MAFTIVKTSDGSYRATEGSWAFDFVTASAALKLDGPACMGAWHDGKRLTFSGISESFRAEALTKELVAKRDLENYRRINEKAA